MPYRRLPNTDQARIRALKAVVAKADTHNLYDLAVSLKTLTEARNFLMRFEAAQSYYVQCFERQSQAGRKHQANVKMARLYISHFIQVLNLAVIRSEVRAAHKSYYGLPTDSSNVPDLSMEKPNELLKEGFLFIILLLRRLEFIMIFLQIVMTDRKICRL